MNVDDDNRKKPRRYRITARLTGLMIQVKMFNSLKDKK